MAKTYQAIEAEKYLRGRVVTAVYLAQDRLALKLEFDNGEYIIGRADGDCCSETWIEEVDSPERLIGVAIQAVEELQLPNNVGYNGHSTTEENPGNGPKYIDQITYYGLKIQTPKGDVVIDFRNNSNGYYGGSLKWDVTNYYSGVYGQNVSKLIWNKIA